MALTINGGYKSLNLSITEPTNTYYIDDVTTVGTTQSAATAPRSDIDKLYVWIGITDNFVADNTTLVYAGAYQNNLVIDRYNNAALFDNTQYFVRYAITSKLEPDLKIIIPAANIAAFSANTRDLGSEVGLRPWIVKTENYTAASGDRIIANTAGGSFTIKLPANPSVGDSVAIADGKNFKLYNLIVDPNGSKMLNGQLQGQESNLRLNVPNIIYQFIYSSFGYWDFILTVGPKGDPGINAKLLTLEASDTNFVYEKYNSTDTQTPSSITFTATRQNIQGTINFIAKAFDKNDVEIGTVTLTGSGDTRILTAANFNTVAGISDKLTIRRVKVTADLTALNSGELFSETITINRLDNGSDAVVHQLTNESHPLPAGPTGVVASYSGASTIGTIYRGAVNETMNWTITKQDTAGLITTLIKPTKISTNGIISNITGTGPWTATITNLTTVEGLTQGDTISALENDVGRLYGGKPTSVVINTINESTNTITYTVTGGTTPIAGRIGGLAKQHNRYEIVVTSLGQNFDSGITTITATKATDISEKTFSVIKSKDGSAYLVLDLTPDNAYVSTEYDGSGGNYSLATSTVAAYIGTINIFPFITNIKFTPSEGITYSVTANGILFPNLTTVLDVNLPYLSITTLNTLSIRIDNLAAAQDSGKLTISLVYLGNTYFTEFTLIKSKAGRTGDPSTIYSLEPNSELQYNPNTETFSPPTITFKAYKTTGTGSKIAFTEQGIKIRLEQSSNNSTWSTIGNDLQAETRTLETSDISKSSKYLRYSLVNTNTQPETVLDTEIDVISQEGVNSSILTVDVENDTHNIPFNSAGTGDYTYSRTKIQVFDNTTELRYTKNSVLTAGYWRITSTVGSGITASSIPDAGANGEKYAEFADHSNMTSKTATITYNIEAVSSKGVVVSSLFGNQTFTKVDDNVIFRIVGAGTISKNKAGTYNSITVKGQKSENGVLSDHGVLTYQNLPSGSESGRSSGTSLAIQPTAGTTSVKVRLYNDANSTTVLDETNIAIVEDGLDATTIVIDVINDTHDIPADSSGTAVSYDYSGTSIQVFANTSELQYVKFIPNTNFTLQDGQWTITSRVGSGITPSSIPDAGANGEKYAEFTNHSNMSSASASITYNIEAKPVGKNLIVGLLGKQTFAKVTRTAIYRIINTQPIVINKDGTINNITINTQKIDGTTTSTPFGFITAKIDSGTESARTEVLGAGYTTQVTSTTAKKVTIKLYETANSSTVLDTADIPVLTDGIDGSGSVSISYSNDVHLVPITGGVTWTGSGGLIRVYEAGDTLTLSSNTKQQAYPSVTGTYNIFIEKVSGNTLTSGSITGEGTGVATLQEWSGSLSQVTVYRITAWIRTSKNKTVQVSTDASLVPTNDITTYSLLVTPSMIGRTQSGSNYTYTPTSANIKFYKIEGKAVPELFSTDIKIKITYSTDGSNFPAQNDTVNNNPTGIGTEAGLAYSIPTNQEIKAVRVRAYNSSNLLLDEETISILPAVKGDKGSDGSSIKDVVLSTYSGTFTKLGSTFNPANVTIAATAQNFTGSIRYLWQVAGSGTLSSTTNSTTVLTPNNTGGITVSVQVYETISGSETLITTKQATFVILTNGVDGLTGKRVATGYVYYLTAQDTEPATPVVTSSNGLRYSFLTNLVQNLPDGWSNNAPVFTNSTTQKTYWSARFSAVEGGPGTGVTDGNPAGTLTFTVQQTIGFSGVVTFSSLQSKGSTIINGENISTGTIKADVIEAGAIVTSKIANNAVTDIYYSRYYYPGPSPGNPGNPQDFTYIANTSTITASRAGFASFKDNNWQVFTISDLPTGQQAEVVIILSITVYPTTTNIETVGFSPYLVRNAGPNQAPYTGEQLDEVAITLGTAAESTTIMSRVKLTNGTYGVLIAGRTTEPGREKLVNSLVFSQLTMVIKK